MNIKKMKPEQLLKQYTYLIRNTASRFYAMPEVKQNFEFQELFDEGVLALLNAQEKFLDKGKPFAEYASYWVDNYIRKMVNARNQIRIPSNILNDYYKIIDAQNKLSLQGMTPSDANVATMLRMPLNKVTETIRTVLASNPASYDAPLDDEGDEDFNSRFASDDTCLETIVVETERDNAIAEALKILTQQEREIILLSFGFHSDPMSITEIADKLGYPEHDITRVKFEALNKLKSSPLIAALAV